MKSIGAKINASWAMPNWKQLGGLHQQQLGERLNREEAEAKQGNYLAVDKGLHYLGELGAACDRRLSLGFGFLTLRHYRLRFSFAYVGY